MAKLITPLTDNKCNTSKPKEKDYRLYDGGNLSLLIKKNGVKSWRIKYKKPDGRETETALGNYPMLTLKEAREEREKLKKLLSLGIDPNEEKKKEKAILASGNTFEAIANKWFNKTKNTEKWSQKTIETRMGRFKNYLFPIIGNRLINTLKLKDFIDVINKSMNKSAHVPSRVRADIMAIMRYAILNNIIDTNPAVDLEGLKLTVKINHHPALPLHRLGEFVNKVLNSDIQRLIQLITLIHLHVFIRSSELRFARWSEIDFANKLWTIPQMREEIPNIKYSYRGGKKRAYLVPLSNQVINLLKELKKFTGDHELIFTLKGYKPICHTTIRYNLRKLGYDTKTELRIHGFRTMACSALIESGIFTKDAIERQMSHQEQNEVRASYNHLAEHLEERVKIMQWWSDYIDHSKEQGYIPPYEFKN